MSLLSDMNVTASQRIEDAQQRTPMRRNNRSASRKNLSRSFSQILNEEEYETRRIEDIPSSLPVIHADLSADDDDDMGDLILRRRIDDPKRLLIRTLSSGASDSLCQTDSGFNDGDLASTCSSGDKLLVASTPAIKAGGDHLRMTTTDDVSMRSFVL